MVETPTPQLEIRPIEVPPPVGSSTPDQLKVFNDMNQRQEAMISGLTGGSTSAGIESLSHDVNLTPEKALLEELQAEYKALKEATEQKLKGEAITGESAGSKKEVSREILEKLTDNEQEYITKSGFSGLTERYADKGTQTTHVLDQINTFAKDRGLSSEPSDGLKDKAFDVESRKLVGEVVQKQIDALFNSEAASKNPEKHRIVTDETKRYLDLLLEAQNEGSLPKDVSAQAMASFVTKNVWKLAYQDRIASESLIGDHGVRHLLGHNVTSSEAIFDQLAANGQNVTAMDRLVAHQTMIDHDLGYAMDPVRTEVNKGNFGADRGHNVQAAKFVRDQADEYGKIFKGEDFSTLHEGVLHHDSSRIDFKVGDDSVQARRENILSAVHLADNTHAFEDKLPELLYRHKDTLKIMRLVKTASEIGDKGLFEGLKSDLIQTVRDSLDYSQDDKTALVTAAGALRVNSSKFLVGRICGNKPEYLIDKNGKTTITVQVSDIHQSVVGAFDTKAYDQFTKFASDLTGKKKADIDLNADSIISSDGKVEIRTRLGKEHQDSKKTDYQQQVDTLLAEPGMQAFIIADAQLASQQKVMEGIVKDNPSPVDNKVLEDIKTERRNKLKAMMGNKETAQPVGVI